MLKKFILFGAIGIALALLIPDLIKIKSNDARAAVVNPEFQAYISGFTSGTISRASGIQIVLKDEQPGTLLPNEPLAEEVFEFDPSVEGKAYWRDNRTIEFIPDKPLKNGQHYTATFFLEKVMKVPSGFEEFTFDFHVVEQDFEHRIEGFKAHDKKDMRWQKLKGIFLTADQTEATDLEKMVSVIQENRKLNISWIHEADGKTHSYTIDSIQRKENGSHVIIRCKAAQIDAKEDKEFKVAIPSLSDFTVVAVRTENSPEQYVSVQFSDPLLPNQDLNGLVRIGNISELNIVSEENELRIFPASRQAGNHQLLIETSVKNIFGSPLKQKITEDILFEEVKPAVRFPGKGVILPDSRNLILPFEAVNLKAVDVTVFQIFENNIPQFLQVNDLNGSEELSRVGRKLYKKRIPLRLATNSEYSKWNRFSLDMSKMIKTESGAIYHVTIDFRKEYSLFDCPDNEGEQNKWDPLTEMNLLDPEEENDSYSYYNDYYYEEDYDWQQRENPCNASYYSYNERSISRNIFASDLGIIAKTGNNGSLLVAVTDLLKTDPLAGVQVEVFDYQHQKIISGLTNAEGIVLENIKRKPFLIVASRGKEKGYLRLDDGSSLSLSQFDVSGETIEKGLKGMIYGERGVWRPGDSLFLSFILEDKEQRLPENHPVSFELSNPNGQLVRKMSLTSGLNGFYNFTTHVEQDAPTGNWTARVKVGGAVFTKNIKIETVMPNRLKLQLNFPGQFLSPGKNEQAELQANWLHGASAGNLKADVTVSLSPVKTVFPKYSNYIFDDAARQLSSEPVVVYEGRTDQNGKATVPVKLAVSENAPGMLNASFTTRVFEEGGAFSIDRFTIPYSPFTSYVGIHLPEGRKPDGVLFNDKSHTVNIVTVDENGKPVSGRRLKAEVYKINWRWWWQRDNDELADFFGRKETEPVFEKELVSANGKGSFQFQIDKEDWGRYYVRVTDTESRHQAGGTIYIDWPDWARRSRKDDESGATMLSLTSDKEAYRTGEKIKLNIPTGRKGRILVTAENGAGIMKSFWVNATEGQSSFEIQATPEMAPTLYLYATYIQPHANTLNDMPIRMYGVIPVKVEDPETHLQPLISMANVLAPETNASITVKEQNGKEMAYTLAVVDEGLLDLTKFKTPDPWNHFYAREALGVRTWDLFEEVMGAYGGRLERLLQIGGDGDLSGKEEAKANRFKPMVKFLGPFMLKKGELKTHTFKMPQYVGSVRVMVVAGDKGAYGSAEKTVPVRKPLMILATMPRVVSPGEKISVPVTVFAMENSVKNVSLRIEANEYFTPVSSTEKSIQFSRTGDQVIDFQLQVNKLPGIGKVKVIATSGKEKAEFPIEIDVRIPNPKMTKIYETVIDNGQTGELSFEPVGLYGTNKGVLEVSVIPPMNLGSRLEYLIQYPYGCIEQTTSSVFPQLVLNQLLELSDPEKKKIERNIKAGISRIKSFQLPGGGLSYWPGDNKADEWGTTYAGHFLLEAEKNGYAIPSNFKSAWVRFQKQRAQSWYGEDSYRSDLVQAYRLYTLALARNPELGAMNRLREHRSLSLAARWKLAGAYALAGQPEAAKALIKNAAVKVEPYKELSHTYGSDLRDEAIILEVLHLTGEKVKAASVAAEISKTLSSDEWLSTQETAYSLLALAQYVGGGSKKGLQFAYSINGAASKDVKSQKPLSQIMLSKNELRKGTASIRNSSAAPLYVRIIMEGIPESGGETDTENNLTLNVRYTDMKGASIDPGSLKQGTDLVAEVTVTHPGGKRKYEQMALVQLFPSGWEIHNSRFYEDAPKQRPVIDYQDIRDDRVYTYFSIRPGESKVFKVQLNAAYTGSFYLPAVSCEAMYDRSIYARVKGKWIQVNKEGKAL